MWLIQEPDPHVFGPPGSGSGSISQRYGSGSGSGSGSFYHQAKKVRKTLIPTALWLLFDFLSLKMMYMYLQKVISKKLLKKLVFCCHPILGRSVTKIAGSESVSGSISQRHGSADPDPDTDPPQNVMDPQHCKKREWTDFIMPIHMYRTCIENICKHRLETGFSPHVLYDSTGAIVPYCDNIFMYN